MKKKHLGLIFAALGALGIAAIVLYDLLRHKPITLLQLIAFGACALLIVMGAALLPLRDQPA